MNPSVPIVLFSDVDGILQSRSFAEAASALDLLKREQIPLVFCSGKTRAEIELIQQELAIRHPFVCENGGAAFIPQGYFGFDMPGARDVAGYEVVEFGRPYTDVVRILHRTAERLRIGIVGFSDISVEQVARDCNLPLLQARLAKLREYEEPFRILDGSAAARGRLCRALHASRLRCVKRGRYDYAGAAIDSAVGANLLCTLYRRMYNAVLTVVLVDGMGDETLLQLADYPVIVPDDDTERGATDVAGWAEMIVDAVQELRYNRTSPSGVTRGRYR